MLFSLQTAFKLDVLLLVCLKTFFRHSSPSGILSFFAVQAGARKVYAIEASSMAVHCAKLVSANRLSDKVTVIAGKVEEVGVVSGSTLNKAVWQTFNVVIVI